MEIVPHLSKRQQFYQNKNCQWLIRKPSHHRVSCSWSQPVLLEIKNEKVLCLQHLHWISFLWYIFLSKKILIPNISINYHFLRQQYRIHQLEVEIKKKRSINQMRRCIKGWSAVIKRKHTAVQFHNKQMVKQLFYCWRGRAYDQIKDKQETREIKVRVVYLDKMKWGFLIKALCKYDCHPGQV